MATEEPINHLEQRLQALFDEAKQLADIYWEDHYTQNLNKAWEDVSRVGVRIRRANGSLDASWFTIRWARLGKAEKSKMLTRHLRRGRGWRYSAAVLNRHAQPWQRELVQKTEDQLASIRAEYSSIRRAIQSLRTADRYASERRARHEQTDLETDLKETNHA